MSESVEVIIVGGGSVGAALACALGTANVSVALVEANRPVEQWPADRIDQRVFAITRASEKLFTALGVWDGMVLRGVSPFREMHVWDAGGQGAVHFDCAEIGEPVLGHIIEHRVIQAALWTRLSQLPSVQQLCPAQVQALEREPGRVTVRIRGGRSLSAALVVGADGLHSQIRSWADLPVKIRDYQQQSIVAIVTTEASHRDTAWQRFSATGPLAFLPLQDGRCAIVWTTTPGDAERLLALQAPEFCSELGVAFAHALGEITQCGPRDTFPLQRLHAGRYVTDRIALAGDAAHAIHPLAGQGVNLGLLDAAALAEVLIGAKAKGRDLGGLTVLRRYERWRKGDNLGMLAAMDGFKALFGSGLPPLPLMRNLGMEMVDRMAPVKNLIMRYATGLSGDLPQLARGIPIMAGS